MPELPEVEVIARGLQRLIGQSIIQEVEVLWPRSVARPEVPAFIQGLAGRRIIDVRRRGKFILFSLDDGRSLLAHLRMTGGFCVFPRTTPPHPYVRVIFHLTDGRDLWYVDIRKFGRLYLVNSPEEVLQALGVEPLSAEFTAERLADILRRRKGAIKPLLLNQGIIAGVGNIYADEALFRAGIHPLRRAADLDMEEVRALHAAIREVLQEAIDHRGTTLRNYRDADGETGQNQFRLNVYRRQGEPCRRCGTPIERIVVGQRGTHFCPHCQPAQP